MDGSTYDGGWTDDNMHGQGTFQWATGECAGDSYEGQWKSGKRHGTGTYTYSSGDSYTGQWKEDVMDGKGSYQRVIQVQVGGAGGSQLPSALACKQPLNVTKHALGQPRTMDMTAQSDLTATNPNSSPSQLHLPPIDAH